VGDQTHHFFIRYVVKGVVHAERGENVFAEIVFQALAGDFFDQLTQTLIQACSVVPALARFEEQRTDGIGLARTRFEIADDWAREIVANTRRVGEEMLHCHLPHRGFEAIGACRGIEGLKDFDLVEFGKIFRYRIFESKTLLFDELHGGDRG